MDEGYDIAIVGRGIVGCIAARCFALCGQKVVIVDAEKQKECESIDIPISIRNANKDFLIDIGLWNGAEAVIQRLHLSAAGHFGVVKVEEEKPMAQVVSAKKWLDHMKDSILREDKSTSVVDGRVVGCHQGEKSILLKIEKKKPIQARRVVVADGARSPLSECLGAEVRRCVKAFRSVIFYVKAHHFTERCAWIRQKGAVIYGAISHKNNQGWVIATMPVSAKRQGVEGNDDLAEDLQSALETHLGAISHAEILTTREGTLQARGISVQPGVISMGNASLQMPPIGAQGLNVAIENCKALYQLQNRQKWHETCPDMWQMQFARSCQPRQDRWYALMERIMLQLAEGSALALLKEKMAWGLLGVDSQLQTGLVAMGKGH